MGKRRLPSYGSYSPSNAHTALIIAVEPLNTIHTKGAEAPGRFPERGLAAPEGEEKVIDHTVAGISQTGTKK
jgi:hypothetical protein